eukprot:CAMPEP_0201480892 /NCGR_PEP_ID=MMETSP0151_2-20130828/5267_1 /ASSEMBLY_ACC=CAM_ASM_000257 /TAXON_ID=200890 /ORGANISM="Paramoeba atlantica, Strain 621/1 / CCAP 1560/9" /LENGTH=34 /DNA_ID= /DNA_START= /DNA_END= /DNA_ORIENTATION=
MEKKELVLEKKEQEKDKEKEMEMEQVLEKKSKKE